MIYIVARPDTPNEPDLLIGYETRDLIFHAEHEEIARIVPGNEPWTHERIEAIQYPQAVLEASHDGKVLDLYLGEQWIGSSEC